MTFRSTSTPFTALALVAALATACDDGRGEGAPPVDVARSEKLRAAPTVTEADRKAVADGNAAFALDMFGQIKKEAQNVVFSPLSISMALGMTWAGARGETESEMARALRFPLPQDRQHAAMNEIDAALAARGEGKMGADGKPFRLNAVNTTWMQKGATFLPAYLDTLAEHYGAGVNLLDFVRETEASRITINDWVAAKTEDRIKNLIPKGAITDDTRLVLTNAVYFNGAWKLPFKGMTTNRPFKKVDGATVTVPTMSHDGPVGYPAFEGTNFTAVALPYDDDRLSMLLVVPDEGKFAAVEAGFDGKALADAVAGLRPRNVSLRMPKFKFETPAPLRTMLETLGMKQAFQPGVANFSGMNGMTDLYIQAVLHKAFIAVAEKGTEAAAATAVIVGTRSAPIDDLVLTVDRPFLFFLRDEPTGAILFVGRVLDPSQTDN